MPPIKVHLWFSRQSNIGGGDEIKFLLSKKVVSKVLCDFCMRLHNVLMKRQCKRISKQVQVGVRTQVERLL